MKAILEWLNSLDHHLLEDHDQLEERARLLLLDTLACSVAGLAAPEMKHFGENLTKRLGGTIRLPGIEGGVGLLEGSFLLTMGACWHEACEGLARAHGRPGLHAVPPAVVLGLQCGASLGQLLKSIIWGYEVGGRAGEILRIGPKQHVDGSWGALASAVTAARMLGLNAERTGVAVEIAASQMPVGMLQGLFAGKNCRNTYAAQGAQHGIWAALAAESGITAPEGTFEASRQVTFTGDLVQSHQTLPSQVARPSRFYLLEGYLKPFAAARHVHYPAACALKYRELHGVPSLENIEEIRLKVYPEALHYCGNRAPHNALQAQFSVSYGTAFALLRDRLGPEAYQQENLTDPDIRRLEARIVLEETHQFTERGSELIIRADSGEHRVMLATVPGDPDQPLNRAEVSAKAKDYLTASLSKAAAQRLIDAILDGERESPFVLPW